MLVPMTSTKANCGMEIGVPETVIGGPPGLNIWLLKLYLPAESAVYIVPATAMAGRPVA